MGKYLLGIKRHGPMSALVLILALIHGLRV